MCVTILKKIPADRQKENETLHEILWKVLNEGIRKYYFLALNVHWSKKRVEDFTGEYERQEYPELSDAKLLEVGASHEIDEDIVEEGQDQEAQPDETVNDEPGPEEETVLQHRTRGQEAAGHEGDAREGEESYRIVVL